MNSRGALIMGSGGTNLHPKMPSQFYKTFQVAAPVGTHRRKATCAEVECDGYVNGWTFKKADLVAGDLYKLVTHAGKRYREMKLDDSADVYLVFEPGQMCFQASTHTVSLERPQFFLAGRGDHRTYNPRNANRFDNADDWVESFAEHQDIIKRVYEEGI